MKNALLSLCALALLLSSSAQLTNLPAPGLIPQPGPRGEGPYIPQPLFPGGIVLPLWPADSPQLNKSRLSEPEHYSMTRGAPGRVSSITNIHDPSIEVHTVDPGINTGAAIILVPGGGHNQLVVGTEGSDFVPFFYNYGVNTVILRYRLRKDGYKAETDAVNDAMQAVRIVRAKAADFGIDPNKIGMIGFSAGAELVAPAALFYEGFAQTNSAADDPYRGVSPRPDFVALLYPGPTPFTRNPQTPIPYDTPPAFLASPGSSDRIHAIWANHYFTAMLDAGIPNLEMHIYANGAHGNGMRDRNGSPLGTWQHRFIDWMRDLDFLGKPGEETKAAVHVKAFVNSRSKPGPFIPNLPREPRTNRVNAPRQQ